MKSVAAASLLLAGAHALPELSVAKRDAHLRVSDAASGLAKRAAGTVTTNVFDILTWSSGGAYYANGTPNLLHTHQSTG